MPAVQHSLRQLIEEVKTYVLCYAFAFEMREIAARIPAIARFLFGHNQSIVEKRWQRVLSWCLSFQTCRLLCDQASRRISSTAPENLFQVSNSSSSFFFPAAVSL